MPVPTNPLLYHIVHVDRLPSIIGDGYLFSDAIMKTREGTGTTIGLTRIKQRRLEKALSSFPTLHVGDCVPFYFCPRSVMLYLIHMRNAELEFQGGQDDIVHLVFRMNRVIEFADASNLRWSFTTSNAGSYYFEDYNSLNDLEKVSWSSVNERWWGVATADPKIKEGKQAEFLSEDRVPWNLVQKICIKETPGLATRISGMLDAQSHRPQVEYQNDWYY